MEFISKLESTIGGWVKNVPHLPASGQRWLGQNVWWIVLIGAILAGIGILFAIGGIFTLIALLSAVSATYYVTGVAGIGALGIVGAIVALVFLIIQALLLALAVGPLKARLKKGWVILFAAWLVNVLGVVVNSVLTFSVGGFIVGILFGAVGIAISGYFLFEIHGQFAHATKASAKSTKSAKK